MTANPSYANVVSANLNKVTQNLPLFPIAPLCLQHSRNPQNGFDAT